MRFEAVFYLLGRLICIIAALMLLPAVISAFYGESAVSVQFILTAAVTFVTGGTLLVFCRKARDQNIATRDGFLLVTLTWVSISLLGAIPYCFHAAFPTFVDAIFESTSGFTTTGATILTDIEVLPHGILFWRSFSQWIGGLGIVVLAVAILPQLSVGGMQLMKNELPGPTFEQLKPRIKQTALSLWRIYLLFSVVLFVLFWLMGMPIFESLCHMFSTTASGGFSPNNDSMASYGPGIQIIVTLFMFLAGMNFILHHAWLHGDFKRVWRNAEWRFFVLVLGTAFVLVFLSLVLDMHLGVAEAALAGIFQVISIATSTGFTTDNFSEWPYLSRGILFLLMCVGGCAGSTSGGFKQIRMLLLLIMARWTLIKQIYPKSVMVVKVGRQTVSEEVLTGVSNLFLIYMVLFAVATSSLLAFDMDFRTATSAVVSAMSNIGPGLGAVGPAENYGWCPTAVKLLLSACMIIGRLEIFTVLVLFLPAAWKR